MAPKKKPKRKPRKPKIVIEQDSESEDSEQEIIIKTKIVKIFMSSKISFSYMSTSN